MNITDILEYSEQTETKSKLNLQRKKKIQSPSCYRNKHQQNVKE